MRRRDFIKGIAGSAAAWPLAAHAQQPVKLPIIGFLGSDASQYRPWVAAFVERLRELGWIGGRTIQIEYRWSEGRSERVAETVVEFVGLKVDVIVTSGFAVAAFKQATAIIPIVFPISPDPVRGGLVASLARPGGNATGLSFQSPDLAGKRVELLREIIPHLRRLAIIGDAGFLQAALEMREVKDAASTLGIEITPLEVRRSEDIPPALEGLKADALYVIGTALLTSNVPIIITLALSARLPTMVGASEYVPQGALISYGPNFPDLFRRSAEYVDKILRGAKPGDLPVEQPTKFDLAVNLKTAKAIGVTIPGIVLARADEVIE